MPFVLWRNWAVYLEPIEGIALGPWAGPLAAFIGSVVARLIKPDEFWMFGIIAEPLGVLSAGLLARGKWKQSMAIYSVMLAAYFMHPFGRLLPLWTILDVLFAFALIYPASKFGGKIFNDKNRSPLIPLAAISFITASADSLTRIFLLIPAGLYSIFSLSFEDVYGIFVVGAVYSYVEDVVTIAVSSLAGPKILAAFKEVLGLSAPLS
ncbi:hypothetical protein KEJ43_04235 [Candidatus Bathyarchaeota archaeon]|nr:hypothetical protein [Candidatus Bathyarchaeota archaeon]